MLRVNKPRNARSKRALEKREAKEIENPKRAIFVQGLRVSEKVRKTMTELAGLKKPNVLMFNKKNEIVPFDDPSSLEFFAAKNDASLFVIGSTQKKRKDNLVWVRTFDGQVMDMLEMGVLEEKAMREFKGTLKPGLGNRPLFHFSGPQFAIDESLDTTGKPINPAELATSYLEHEFPAHQHFKSLVMDFFRGEELPTAAGLRPGEHQIALTGLQHVICVTAGHTPTDAAKQGAELKLDGSATAAEADKLAQLYAAASGTGNSSGNSSVDRTFEGSILHFRTYAIDLRSSGSRKPRVELQECGPSFDFVLRRRKAAPFDMLVNALKRPKSQLEKNTQGKGKRKNIDTDEMGDMVGRVHLGKQDLDNLQTRKMKGLRPARGTKTGEELADDDEEAFYEEGDDGDDQDGDQLEMEDMTMPDGAQEVDDQMEKQAKAPSKRSRRS